ncbi:MAG: alkaline phosphatase family protein [Xanthomonadaceae bacterium]|nr:alkaline phosphatase family protein [Xanthomonadaceae bacterium]
MSAGYRDLLLDTAVVWAHMSLPSMIRASTLPELGAQWKGFVDAGPQPEGREDHEDAPHAIRWNQRMLEFEAFMESLDSSDTAKLHYLHTLLPHAPWIHLPDGRVYDLSRADSIYGMVPGADNQTGIKHLWHESEWATLIGEQRYHLQLQFVDRLIERVLDRLASSEHFEDLMLVVASDHGAAFTAGTSRRALTAENFGEILPVPLFIKYPGQTEGRMDNAPAELLDVTPTIRDVLGLGVDGLDGRSLLNEPRDRKFKPRLINEHGKYFEFEAEEFELRYQFLIQRMHERFSWEDDGFARLAEFADWYGLPVKELADQQVASGQQLLVSNTGQWQHIDTAGRFLPARLVGQLREPERGNRVFVATVNERIGGFGRPYNYPGADQTLEILLDDRLFRDGYNEIAVYRMNEESDEVTLERVYSNTENVSLSSDAEHGLHLHLDDSERVRKVGTGPPWGSARITYNADQRLYELGGWAGDPLTGTTAEEIHVFIDENRIGSTSVSDQRPDLVERYGRASLGTAGFRLPLPIVVDSDRRYGILRVVAVDADGLVSQLPLSGIEENDLPFGVDTEFRAVPISDPATQAAKTRRAAETGTYSPGTWIAPAEASNGAPPPGISFEGDWHPTSQPIRWGGRDVRVCLAIEHPAGPFRLEIEAIPFTHTSELPEQEIVFSINGLQVDRWVLDQPKLQTLTASFRLGPGRDAESQRLCLDFHAPDAAVPAELNVSEDKRELGLAFRRLRLVRAD